MLVPLVFVTMTYFVAGLAHSATLFFKVYLAMALNFQCGAALGIMLGSLVDNAVTLGSIKMMITMPFI